MRTALVVLSILALPAADLAAAQRARSVSVRKVSGRTYRTQSSGPAAQGSSGPPTAVFRQGVMAAPSGARPSPSGGAGPSGGRAFSRGARPASRAFSSFGRTLAPARPIQRRIDAPSEPAPAPEPGAANPVPGALIRTEGLGAKIAPAEPARLHAIEAGGRVSADGSAQILNPQQGLRVGPKDTLPPPSPGSVAGDASGRTAVTANRSSD